MGLSGEGCRRLSMHWFVSDGEYSSGGVDSLVSSESNSKVYNYDLESNYTLIREWLVACGPVIPVLSVFESAFVLLAVNLNIHGECIFHQRGGKGKCRDTCLHSSYR